MFKWIWSLFKPVRCTCVLSDLVGIGNAPRTRNHDCPMHGDAAYVNKGICPDCHGTSFLLGPEGGCATNAMCEGCGAHFAVEVLDLDSDPIQIVYWGRVW